MSDTNSTYCQAHPRVAARSKANHIINMERGRQIELWGDIPLSLELRLPVLVEEVGEVATAIQDESADELLAELSQVAAVALRWMEDLILDGVG